MISARQRAPWVSIKYTYCRHCLIVFLCWNENIIPLNFQILFFQKISSTVFDLFDRCLCLKMPQTVCNLVMQQVCRLCGYLTHKLIVLCWRMKPVSFLILWKILNQNFLVYPLTKTEAFPIQERSYEENWIFYSSKHDCFILCKISIWFIVIISQLIQINILIFIIFITYDFLHYAFFCFSSEIFSVLTLKLIWFSKSRKTAKF